MPKHQEETEKFVGAQEKARGKDSKKKIKKGAGWPGSDHSVAGQGKAERDYPWEKGERRPHKFPWKIGRKKGTHTSVERGMNVRVRRVGNKTKRG